tara:strand:+ start:97 stop:597 length:501 start_codon:yes stop_codon:yes gene_type:complete
MSSTSTTWTIQGTTKAGATSTSTDSLTTGTLTADTLQLSSNIIKASDGGTTITLDTSDNVTIGGGLTVAGKLILDSGSFGNSSTNNVSGANIFTTYASGDLTVTNLTSGTTGQIVVIKNHGDYDITINDGSNFTLAGNWTPNAAGETLMLFYDGSTWVEISRSDNA